MKGDSMKKIIIKWLPLAVTITALAGTYYIGLLQSYRLGADDPQAQYIVDLTKELKTTDDAKSLAAPEGQKIKVNESLNVFAMAYDKDGNVVASSAEIDGKDPALPNGTISNANKYGQSRFTWSPAKDVKIAAIISKTDWGYVLIGRNIREITNRIKVHNLVSFFGLLVALGSSLMVTVMVERPVTKKNILAKITQKAAALKKNAEKRRTKTT